MHYYQSCAAKGTYGDRERFQSVRSMQRASVNVYRTESTYEILVFAPGRIKQHFKLEVKGRELTVSYTPPKDFPQVDWVLREYSRGGFQRIISLDNSIDTANIKATYVDGVLQVSLPILAAEEMPGNEINIE